MKEHFKISYLLFNYIIALRVIITRDVDQSQRLLNDETRDIADQLNTVEESNVDSDSKEMLFLYEKKYKT